MLSPFVGYSLFRSFLWSKKSGTSRFVNETNCVTSIFYVVHRRGERLIGVPCMGHRSSFQNFQKAMFVLSAFSLIQWLIN